MTKQLRYSLPIVSCTTILFFMFLIVLRVVLHAVWAFKRRAHWIPGTALVLSALSIQVITFVGNVNLRIAVDLRTSDVQNLIYSQLLLDGCRLYTCVFMGYLMPGMVLPGSATYLRRLAAFVLGLFSQICLEIFYINKSRHVLNAYWKVKANHSLRFWFILFNSILLISIILLVFLLGCVVLVGKTVRGNLRQRISSILCSEDEKSVPSVEESDLSPKDSWDKFEAEVFKSWFVARVCRPDFVLARSVLSSAVGLLVTLCIFLSALKTGHHHHKYHLILSYNGLSSVAILFLAFAFVLVGWIIICWRWFAALIYFPGHAGGCFRVEKFWTSSIVELIRMCQLKGDRLSGHRKKTGFSMDILLTKTFTKLRLHKLLYILFALQTVIVLFSKCCCLLSEMVLGKFMRLCCKHIRMKAGECKRTTYRYEVYKEMLERLCMPGERPSDLWQANRSSIKKIENLMRKAREQGTKCHIISSLPNKLLPQCLERGFGFAEELRKAALPQVVKYFPNLEKQCWKMTAVSLVLVLLELDRPTSDRVTNAIEACYQAWDLLNFVDTGHFPLPPKRVRLRKNLDIETDHLSLAAEKEFYKLQQRYTFSNSSDEPAHDIPDGAAGKSSGEPAQGIPVGAAEISSDELVPEISVEAADKSSGEPPHEINLHHMPVEAADKSSVEPAHGIPVGAAEISSDEPVPERSVEAVDKSSGEPAHDVGAALISPHEPVPHMPVEAEDKSSCKHDRKILEKLYKSAREVLETYKLLAKRGKGDKKVADSWLLDSSDWIKIALSYNMYKLCEVMKDHTGEDLAAWIEKMLSIVIACSLSKIPDMIVKHCRKLADEFDENQLWETIFHAAKARGMMESWRLQHKRRFQQIQPDVEWELQLARVN